MTALGEEHAVRRRDDHEAPVADDAVVVQLGGRDAVAAAGFNGVDEKAGDAGHGPRKRVGGRIFNHARLRTSRGVVSTGAGSGRSFTPLAPSSENLRAPGSSVCSNEPTAAL